MSYIGATPAESYASFYVQHFTTSATTSYALDYPVVNENDLRLVINNVVQQPGSSYAYTAAASTLTLSAATTTSDTMYTVFLGRALQTVNPPADSVGGSQLADSAISGQTALGAEPADTDEFLVSDAGVLKRMDYSYIKGGAGLVKIETKEFSSANATIDFENCFSSTYDNYFLTGWLQNDNTNWALRGLQGYGATPTWVTASEYYNFTIKGYNPSTLSYDYFSAAAYYDFGFAGGCGDTALGITIDFANFGSGLVGVNEPILFYRHYGLGGNSYDRTEVTVGAARLNDANQPTSWRFDASNGDFEKGCVTMYGLAK